MRVTVRAMVRVRLWLQWYPEKVVVSCELGLEIVVSLIKII
jgi:hypothetical protein